MVPFTPEAVRSIEWPSLLSCWSEIPHGFDIFERFGRSNGGVLVNKAFQSTTTKYRIHLFES